MTVEEPAPAWSRAAGRRPLLEGAGVGADRALLGLAVGLTAMVLAAQPLVVWLDRDLVRHAPAAADPTWVVWTGVVFTALLVALALAVVVRERRNPVGWLLLSLIVSGAAEDAMRAAGLVGLDVPGHHVAGAAGWAALSESLSRLDFGVVFAILLLFPTGRPPSRAWRPVLVAVTIVFPLWFVAHLLRPGNPEEPPFRGVRNPWAVGWFDNPVLHYGFLPLGGLLGLVVLASLVVRYRASASAGDERQQLRWLGLLAAGAPIGLVALGVAGLVGGTAMNAVGDVIWVFPQVGLPVAVAIAITRYRLYDLDLVLNRTVVYASLCVLLAATYAAVVLLATRLVVSAGWTSPWVVAAATLTAAAVAAPARRWIQDGVDRLFGRRAWAAERLLTAFTADWSDTPAPPPSVRDALAAALRDPGVELGFWLRSRGGYVDADHRELPLPVPGGPRSALAISAGGEPVAVVVHDAALDRDRRLLAAVARSAALVVENARLQVEVLAQVAEVEASRARIVSAGDAERRRVERDLHDGAQQRLVGLAMRVRLAARTSAEADLLEGVAAELQAATRELRELARGLHPAALSDGLGAAVESLVLRSPTPVELDLPVGRLPAALELTAYYVVAECLTNAARHAQASRVEVSGRRAGEVLLLSVHDDGRGGADPARGTGLAGLADRLAVVGGRLEIDSPEGRGTTVLVSLPCAC